VTASPAVAIDEDDERQADHEATMVGQVPRNLLELSSSGDENTRAYTAPQELIELAKRKREERLNAKVAPEAHSKETERPPAQQRRAAAAKSAKPSEVPAPLTRRADPAAAPSWPEEDSAPAVAKSDQPSEVAAALARRAAPAAAPSRPEEDSAPAVLRTNSGEMEAVRSSERAPPSAAPSVAGEALDFDEPPSEPASVEPAPAVRARADMSPASVALSLSSYKTPWLTAPRRWALLVALFVLVGLVLSRWRAIEALLLR
jgi:hypothetical protein